MHEIITAMLNCFKATQRNNSSYITKTTVLEKNNKITLAKQTCH